MNIHAMWLMEEKAKSFLIEDWFKPPKAPVRADKIKNGFNKKFILWIIKSKKIGASFCQVKSHVFVIHDNPDATLTNQLWKGEAPSFIIIVTIRIISNTLKLKKWKVWMVEDIMEEKIKVIDAIVWIRKYLIEDSDWREEEWFKINGMKAAKLISNPNHALKRLEEEMDKIDPEININMNRIDEGDDIKKGFYKLQTYDISLLEKFLFYIRVFSIKDFDSLGNN